jgi:hypothetical protein
MKPQPDLIRDVSGRYRTYASSKIVPAAGLAGLILLFFNKMALSHLILARGDTLLYFYPYWQAAADALRTGRLPLWNSNLFMGAPMLANSQIGFFYPLNWPLWLLLPVPTAVSATVLLHLFIGGWGTFLAARTSLALGRTAAFLSSVLFALGGYLTAQVEHVNQLQGLAWLPWYLVVLNYGAGDGPRLPRLGSRVLAFGSLFALQFLAGHAQTTFISAVGILLWLAGKWLFARFSNASANEDSPTAPGARPPLHLLPAILLGALLALAITAVQLLPTLELARLSARQGGLAPNEALSFSLPPFLLARALLPHYGQSLFSEYLAPLPVTALMLAVLGAWHWRQRQDVLPALLFVMVGLLLALGLYLPTNWLLARMPLFNLFRVPARWLILYALGVSLLAGHGWQILWQNWQSHRPNGSRWRHPDPGSPRHLRRPATVAGLILLALVAWSLLAIVATPFFPSTPEAPFEASQLLSILSWLLELLFAFLLISPPPANRLVSALFPAPLGRISPGPPVILVPAILLIMFFASREHPYNNLTAPEAFSDLRPTVARLQAIAGCVVPGQPCPFPPDRFLSLSDIFFDPGDQAEMDTIYAQQLSEAARYDLTIAAKQKEIIAPNLPLAFDLNAVDGFDGGILPLRAYNQTMTLILPEGVSPGDGRLRENLDYIPEARWLDLFNARYLITDKLSDVWRQSIFFDRQHPLTLANGETAAVSYLPLFEATSLWLLSSAPPDPADITTGQGEAWRLAFEPTGEELYRATFPDPVTPKSITLTSSPGGSYQAAALTLVDDRDGAFAPLVLGNYRLVHSGDVKMYENLDVLPRAFLIHSWRWQATAEAAVAAMRAPEFDPRTTAVLLAEDQQPGSTAESSAPEGETVTIESHEPERVVIDVSSQSDGILILTDGYYPGWTAVVDGQPVQIFQADGMFRGVRAPSGHHQVIFAFRPKSVYAGAAITAAGILCGIAIAFLVFIRSGRR